MYYPSDNRFIPFISSADLVSVTHEFCFPFSGQTHADRFRPALLSIEFYITKSDAALLEPLEILATEKTVFRSTAEKRASGASRRSCGISPRLPVRQVPRGIAAFASRRIPSACPSGVATEDPTSVTNTIAILSSLVHGHNTSFSWR